MYIGAVACTECEIGLHAFLALILRFLVLLVLNYRLDDVGRDQAKALGAHIRRHRIPIQLVVVSPLRRTLETATQAFGTSVPMLAVELVREAHGAHPCDKRSPVSEVSSSALSRLVVVVVWNGVFVTVF